MSLRVVEIECEGCGRVMSSQTEEGKAPGRWLCPDCVGDRYADWLAEIHQIHGLAVGKVVA